MLPREHRLRNKKQIERVFNEGRSASAGFLCLKFLPSNEKATKVAFSIGLGFSKKATERNRLRRQLRSLIGERLEKIPGGYDLVFYLRKVNTPVIKKADLEVLLIRLIASARLEK